MKPKYKRHLINFILGTLSTVIGGIILYHYTKPKADIYHKIDIYGEVYAIRGGEPSLLENAKVYIQELPSYSTVTGKTGAFIIKNVDYSSLKQLTLIAEKNDLKSREIIIKSLPPNKKQKFYLVIP